MPLSLDGTTGISASGNIVGNNISVSGTLTAGTFSPASLSASGNITGGNILVAGAVSATGNVTGNYLLGNAALVTGLSASSISSGTSNVNVVSSGGNVTVGVGGTSNVSVFSTTGVFVTGVASATGNVTGGNINTAGLVTATGNIQGGNIRTAGIVSATSTVFAGADLTLTGNIVDTAAMVISTSSNGNITLSPNGTGVVVTNTDIRNGQASGTGNIGASGATFNTIFAKATSAQYADLAEMYESDKKLDPGQVVEFGGPNEIQQTTTTHSTKVAGIISTNPSYLMNAQLQGELVYPVALTGRVPCYVTGKIKKGDLLVSSDVRAVATVLDIDKYQPGCVIGKALEDFDSQEIGRIEVAVGRF